MVQLHTYSATKQCGQKSISFSPSFTSPYFVFILVSGKIFLPGSKESYQQLQAYSAFYQIILEKSMSLYFPEFISNLQRTLKNAACNTCWLESLTIWLTALAESHWCGQGRSQGKDFSQKKGEWRLGSQRQISSRQCSSSHLELQSFARVFGTHSHLPVQWQDSTSPSLQIVAVLFLSENRSQNFINPN